MPDRILAVMDVAGFDPARLSFEVTETALLSDHETARIAIERFQSRGVKVLLDDFGAGFASISYLREFAFDGIKLDGSLVATIAHSQKARNLLLGVVHLCQAIGTMVTVEMVESDAQLAILRSLPIGKFQGYLFSRALTADAAGNLFEPLPTRHAVARQSFGV